MMMRSGGCLGPSQSAHLPRRASSESRSALPRDRQQCPLLDTDVVDMVDIIGDVGLGGPSQVFG
jgi:hypothetical protein